MDIEDLLVLAPLALSVLSQLNTEVLDCMALEADQCVSLAFLALVEHVDVVDVEHPAVCMAVEIEYVVDTEEILDLQDTDHKERMISDMELVGFPILY